MTGMTPEEAENFYVEDEDPAPLFAAYDAARRTYDAQRSGAAFDVAELQSYGKSAASRAVQLITGNPSARPIYDLSVTIGAAVAAGTS
jgi:hypothetical protein